MEPVDERNREEWVLRSADSDKLVVTWIRNFEDIQLSFGGHALGAVPSKAALKAGYICSLPTGDEVLIRYHSAFFNPGFEIRLNGQHLESSSFRPERITEQAGLVLYVVAAGSLVLILWRLLTGELDAEWGVFVAISGVLALVAGYLVQRRHSVVAAILALAFLTFDLTLKVADWQHLAQGGVFLFIGILVRLAMLAALWRAIRVLPGLAKQAASPEESEAYGWQQVAQKWVAVFCVFVACCFTAIIFTGDEIMAADEALLACLMFVGPPIILAAYLFRRIRRSRAASVPRG